MAKKKQYNPKEDRVFHITSVIWLLLAMAVCWVIDLLLPLRWVLVLSVVGCVGSLALLIAGMVGKKNEVFIWCMPFLLGVCMMSFIGFMDKGLSYSFPQEPFVPFWEISLILGAALGAFVTVKIVWKQSGIGGRIGSFVLVTLISALFIMITVCHLNYLLDLQPPTEIHAVIEDKEITHHRKSPDSYEFELTVDGESFDLEVGKREYKRYEVGDTYTFKEYTGAFGKPFYVAEE